MRGRFCIALDQVEIAFLDQDDLIVPHSFVGVVDDQRFRNGTGNLRRIERYVFHYNTGNGRCNDPLQHLSSKDSMVLTRLEAGHFPYIVQEGRCFYETQIEPGAVSVQLDCKKERHFGNEKAVPAYMLRHIELLEQLHAFGTGWNEHSCL